MYRQCGLYWIAGLSDLPSVTRRGAGVKGDDLGDLGGLGYCIAEDNKSVDTFIKNNIRVWILAIVK